ncbi:major facilitator superfamily domain-containing protein [Mycena latifolia]|nr:major facilitator superfamily domain-containing protein [Mycena latifolia]
MDSRSPEGSPRQLEGAPSPVTLEPPPAMFTHDLGFLPIPKTLRYHPGKSFHFGLLLNIALGFTSTFTVANLYYCQPLLSAWGDTTASFGTDAPEVDLAASFDMLYADVSQYAIGVVLISPLADLVRRRQLILLLLIISTALTVVRARRDHELRRIRDALLLRGCYIHHYHPHAALVAAIAPPERRATALSVVISSLLGGLAARVLSGVLGQFASWRSADYLGIGAQALALLMRGAQLRTMAVYAVMEPALVQACLINFATSAAFTSFWVTLTFLLGGPLYRYDTLDSGLFGLVGMLGVLTGPLMGRLIDRLVLWYATLLAVVFLGVFNAVQLAAGGLSIGAVIVVAVGLNLFRQLLQAALATTVLSIAAEARGQMNAVNVLSIFLGQVMGTSAGSRIYLQHGWRACAALSLALSGWQLLILLAHGPHCARRTWVGWEEGWAWRKRAVELADAESQLPPEAAEGEKEIREASGEEEDADPRDGEKVLSTAGGPPEKRLED